MDLRRGIVTAIAVAGFLLLPGGSVRATSHLKAPCPAGYVQDGAVKTVGQGGLEYTCKPAPRRKITCGPGTEYFAGGCNFGCREKLIVK